MTRQTITLAIDVAAILKRPMSELRGFAHPDGRPMTPRDARIALVAELAGGRELLPVGPTHFSIVKSST